MEGDRMVPRQWITCIDGPRKEWYEF